MEPEPKEHRQLCTLELIAEGHAERCPGEECVFWEHGCVLVRVEEELDERPEVASFLLELRRTIMSGRDVGTAEARRALQRRLAAEDA